MPYDVDDVAVDRAEQNQALQSSWDNQLFATDTYYAHPSFARSGVRVDQMTARSDTSQLGMYRAMLRLPPDAPLSVPKIPQVARDGSVLLITESTSWPNTQPKFWPLLEEGLRQQGRRVVLNDRRWGLAELLERCAAASWVIGPQCGVMSILASARFPCRKTFLTPSLDDLDLPNQWAARRTYPYAYVTKFDGCDYDVEEYKIESGNHAALVERVLSGANALGRRPHDPSPTSFVMMPLTPGDFLDRRAVLTVKRERFDPPRRAAIEREWGRYEEAALHFRREHGWSDELAALYDKLLDTHHRAFDLIALAVPASLAGKYTENRRRVDRINRERVALKIAIDELCHAPYTEVKDYF